MEFTDRLNKLLKEKNIKQRDIVDKTNISKGYISKICNGVKPPTELFINAVSELTGKSVHWILYGKEKYDNLDILNLLINTYIDKGIIISDTDIEKETLKDNMRVLRAEIRVKLQNKKRQE